MKTYYCWAEHTAGKSITHHCGITVTDPCDEWEFEVSAENEDSACELACINFREYVRAWEAANPDSCHCGRYAGSLYDSWWDSQSVICSRKGYPDYVGDSDTDGLN